jgi:peptide-methionine (R)-S-oxide reductase
MVFPILWAIATLFGEWDGTKTVHSDAEWRDQLGRERYNVMRKKATEGAFTGKYVFPGRPGYYACGACALLLFECAEQYDAGSGYPSFKKPLAPKNVYYKEDLSFYFKRYEVLCSQCDSHLGHLFRDGPPPKNLRYCINSVALTHLKNAKK